MQKANNDPDRLKVTDHGRMIFKSYIFDPCMRRLVSAITAAMNEARQHDVAPAKLAELRTCCAIFVECVPNSDTQCFTNDLLVPLRQATAAFYHELATSWCTRHQASAYFRACEGALLREIRLREAVLPPIAEAPLLSEAQDALLKVEGMALLRGDVGGLRSMLQAKAWDDLARCFTLYSRVSDGLEFLAAGVREYIRESGLLVLDSFPELKQTGAEDGKQRKKSGKSDADSANALMNSLITLLVTCKDMVERVFSGHALFQKALKDALESIVNVPESTAGYSLLAQLIEFIDRILKGHVKLQSGDDGLQQLLTHCIELFEYILEKDTFGEMYRHALAKRLLHGRSVSLSTEKDMIAKLKLAAGAQFTAKYEGMIRDLENAGSTGRSGAAWEEHARKHCTTLAALQFSPQILTTGWWPAQREVQCALPAPFKQWVLAYEQYYAAAHANRSLAWVHSVGTAALTVSTAQRYTAQVSTLQAIVCVFVEQQAKAAAARTGAAFADVEVSFSEIAEGLGMSTDVTKRVVHSLSCGKLKLLCKHPPPAKGKAPIATTDTFTVNTEFASPQRTVRIPMASLDNIADHQKKVGEDRRVTVDAAIVRIMKSRNVCSHQELVSEVLNALQFFRPDPKLIKQRIEYCIENDYIERSEDDVNMYEYVA